MFKADLPQHKDKNKHYSLYDGNSMKQAHKVLLKKIIIMAERLQPGVETQEHWEPETGGSREVPG